MTDTETIWDEAKREAREEFIRTHTVITLRPVLDDMPARQRAAIALTVLQDAIEAVEMLADNLPHDAADTLDRIERRISHLRPRLRMKKGLLHLCSQFGRAL